MGVNGKKTRFVHEWPDDHAWSLPNVGLFTGIKLLGYVDLPGDRVPDRRLRRRATARAAG